MLIVKSYALEFDRYTDVYLTFYVDPSNSHYICFKNLIKRLNDNLQNENLKEVCEGKFDYFNHCINSPIVLSCVNELDEIRKGKKYNTKSDESMTYKVIQILELLNN